jgi:hypothetical protein
MESGDYKNAIQLFERARAQMRPHESNTLGGLTGELPNGYVTTYRNRSQSLTDIWMEV